jgi:glycosyltransferase involved in cell wall biosynthesis
MISIIIPVYNAEKYLSKCLESILNQTYTDFEVVAVDDGSADKSTDILQSYTEKDNRIKYIKQSNQGSSAARNAALRICQGEMIAFVDSDDWLSPVFLETLHDMLDRSQADIAVCDFMTNGKTRESEYVWGEETYWDDKEAILREFTKDGFYNRVMNKVYRRDLVQDVEFPVGRDLKEDAVWTTKVLLRANSVIRIPEGLYNLRIVPDSLSRHRRYSETFLCGMYRNDLDKCEMLLSEVKDKEVADKIRVTAWEVIQCALLSFIDLTKFDVDKKIIELVTKNKTYFDEIDAESVSITNQLVETKETISASRILIKKKLFHGTLNEKKRVLSNWLISTKRRNPGKTD